MIQKYRFYSPREVEDAQRIAVKREKYISPRSAFRKDKKTEVTAETDKALLVGRFPRNCETTRFPFPEAPQLLAYNFPCRRLSPPSPGYAGKDAIARKCPPFDAEPRSSFKGLGQPSPIYLPGRLAKSFPQKN